MLPAFQNRYGTGLNASSARGRFTAAGGERLNKANYMGYDPASDYFQTGATVPRASPSRPVRTTTRPTFRPRRSIRAGSFPTTVTTATTSPSANDQLPEGPSDARRERQLRHPEGPQHDQPGCLQQPAGVGLPLPARQRLERRLDVRALRQARPNSTRSTGPRACRRHDLRMQNPYWINYRNLRENRKDRYMLQRTASYDILDWLCFGPPARRQRLNGLHREVLRLDEHAADRGVAKRPLRHHHLEGQADLRRRAGQHQQDLRRGLVAAGQRRRLDFRHAYDAMKVRGPIPDGGIPYEKPLLANVFNVWDLVARRHVCRTAGASRRSRSSPRPRWVSRTPTS